MTLYERVIGEAIRGKPGHLAQTDDKRMAKRLRHLSTLVPEAHHPSVQRMISGVSKAARDARSGDREALGFLKQHQWLRSPQETWAERKAERVHRARLFTKS
jgi:hypothetical protein